MIDEQILVPSWWRSAVGSARALLAGACLVVELSSGESSGLLLRVLLATFLVYAVLALIWGGLHRPSYALLALIVDFLFFLVAATIEAGSATWICAAFYLFLMATAVLFHHWRQVLLLSLIGIGLFPLIRPTDVGLLLPAFVMASVLALLGSREKELLVRRLMALSKQAVLFRSEAEKAREVERERIAADFHDGPLQSFISLQMRLEILRRLLERDSDAGMNELLQLQGLARGQVAEIRAFVRSMRPVEVDAAGLTAALGRLVDTFQKDTGISSTFLGSGSYDPDDPEVAGELVKIVREALHNTQKHAGASRVAVGMEKANGALEVLIQDDGSGFSFAGTYSLEELDMLRLGPESIKRRVRSLGGDLVVESRPGAGAGLRIRIPA
ncbi:MAG: sensor histidine kinase [bacterium]|nr:sensor histidine kinase [bacterium]